MKDDGDKQNPNGIPEDDPMSHFVDFKKNEDKNVNKIL